MTPILLFTKLSCKLIRLHLPPHWKVQETSLKDVSCSLALNYSYGQY